MSHSPRLLPGWGSVVVAPGWVSRARGHFRLLAQVPLMEFVWPKQGLLRCAGFSSLALVLTRPLPVAYVRSSCWAPRGPWPKTLQELMAEAGMGDAGHPHRLQSSLEFGVPDNPAIEENSSQEAPALLPALPH